MEKLTLETEKILNERFNKDNIIALATVQDGMPYVRNVNGFYEDSSFYVDGVLFSHGTRYNIDFCDKSC